MAKMDINFIIILLVGCLALTQGLSSSELSKFTNAGTEEKNTGARGSVSITTSGDYHTLTSNGIPDHATGTFPASSNPNSIKEQSHSYRISKSPEVATDPTCMPMGPIAFALNGVPLFNPYTIEQTDAVVNEIFDDCKGHPDPQGNYHYHQSPSCIDGTEKNELIGVALDGFPIYGNVDENGDKLTTKDLDQCHGRMVNNEYRYHLTEDFPYIMGCFKGEPSPDISSRRFDRDCTIVSLDGNGSGVNVKVNMCLLLIMYFVLAAIFTM